MDLTAKKQSSVSQAGQAAIQERAQAHIPKAKPMLSKFGAAISGRPRECLTPRTGKETSAEARYAEIPLRKRSSKYPGLCFPISYYHHLL